MEMWVRDCCVDDIICADRPFVLRESQRAGQFTTDGEDVRNNN